MVSPFRLEWPGQKILDRGVDIKSSIQDRGDRICDRHLDALLARHLEQHRGREDALCELTRRLGSMRRLTLPKRDAEREVARLRALAAQDEVAEAGQAGQRLWPCP